MKFKINFFIKNYFYLIFVGIVISFSAFSCEEEEVQPTSLEIKFINKTGINLSDIATNRVSISRLENNQETDYITTENFIVYSFISATDDKGFRYYYDRGWCGTENPINEEDYLPNGKYTFSIIMGENYGGDNYFILEEVK